MTSTRFVPAALILAAVFAMFSNSATAADKESRFFELRTYTTNPGKLEALKKRFRNDTNRIFKKHGMQIVGFWTPVDGDEAKNTLVYMLAYPSREAREKSWKAFIADPEWQKAYKQSHVDAGGKIVIKVVNKFLTPTDFSPIQ